MPKRIWFGFLRTMSTPAVRYPPDPRALFVLLMCVIVAIPLIFANATPGTIAAQLDDSMIVAWGIMLCGGSALTLFGVLRQTATGVICEQVGSVALGFACLIYATAIWFTVEWGGAVPMFLLLAYTGASAVRYFQLRAYLRNVEHLAQDLRDEAGE